MTDPSECAEPQAEERTVTIAVEGLPFPFAHDEARTWRAWVFKEVHGFEVPMNDATLEYCEKAFQWITKGKPKEKKPFLKAVK